MIPGEHINIHAMDTYPALRAARAFRSDRSVTGACWDCGTLYKGTRPVDCTFCYAPLYGDMSYMKWQPRQSTDDGHKEAAYLVETLEGVLAGYGNAGTVLPGHKKEQWGIEFNIKPDSIALWSPESYEERKWFNKIAMLCTNLDEQAIWVDHMIQAWPTLECHVLAFRILSYPFGAWVADADFSCDHNLARPDDANSFVAASSLTMPMISDAMFKIIKPFDEFPISPGLETAYGVGMTRYLVTHYADFRQGSNIIQVFRHPKEVQLYRSSKAIPWSRENMEALDEYENQLATLVDIIGIPERALAFYMSSDPQLAKERYALYKIGSRVRGRFHSWTELAEPSPSHSSPLDYKNFLKNADTAFGYGYLMTEYLERWKAKSEPKMHAYHSLRLNLTPGLAHLASGVYNTWLTARDRKWLAAYLRGCWAPSGSGDPLKEAEFWRDVEYKPEAASTSTLFGSSEFPTIL
nr:hypothetical protein [Rhizoctonia zeae hypovirus 1]